MKKWGDIPNAIVNYQKETEVSPSNFGAYMNMGLLQLQTGHADDGAVTFKRLLALQPGDPRASFLLAESYNLLNTNLERLCN
jgi:Tfp pilus assembly protein PilF